MKIKTIIMESIKSNKMVSLKVFYDEIFNVFLLIPIMMTASICIAIVFLDLFVFKIIMVVPIFCICLAVYAFLWFWKFGKKKKNTHEGNE